MRRFWSIFSTRAHEILLLWIGLQFGFIALGGWLESRRWVAGLVLAAIVVAVLLQFWVDDRRRRRRRADLGKVVAFQRARRGVVFTLGLRAYEQSTCPLVLRHLTQVTAVGLVVTQRVFDECMAGYEAAMRDQGLEVAHRICDENEVRDISARTAELLDWLLRERRIPAAEVAVDVTGGLALMSLGAFIAAEDRSVECQYILSQYDGHGRPLEGTQVPIIVAEHV